MKAASYLLAACLFGLMFATPSKAFNFNLNDIGKVVNIAKKTTDLKEVDEKGEIAIGDGVASNLLGAAPLVRNEALQQYVNQVGRWLAMQTERPDLPWHFGVLDSMNVNAFAAPGGYIFITRGLLMKMHSESELAGVLAHEISHVLRRHHLNSIQKSAQVGIMGDVLNIAAERNQNSAALKKVVSTGTELYSRGLDKDDEFEADRMGIVIATRAGYDPFGLPAVLQTLDHMNAQDSSLALMFKTHPTPASRLTLLDGLMLNNFDAFPGQTVENRFRKITAAAGKK